MKLTKFHQMFQKKLSNIFYELTILNFKFSAKNFSPPNLNSNFTQIRAVSRGSEPKSFISEGFDSFDIVPETPPTPIENENFGPFQMKFEIFGDNLSQKHPKIKVNASYFTYQKFL